ncbi:MAG: HlyD family efflux transporter periplasmic adaptor subunit, partial [Planctomycetota bacterium]|nr:HlyD family efflux transporter periplasmic adaptor subunit [Planctomycetota bacterium]
VSDAWMLPRREARIAISAAGIIAELVIAACAAMVWWRSEPGVAQSVALALTATCSVNTLLLNGNPLLRYDGYYILMDLLEEPHLAEDALGFWRDLWRKWGLGMDVAPPSRSGRPRQFLLAIYGAAAAIYRCLVLIAILWFARAAIAAAGFPDAGQLVMTIGGAACLTIPVVGVVRAVRDPGWRRRLNSNIAIRNLLILGALLATFWFVPLPRRISADLIVEAPGAPRVYVAVPGRLDQTVPADSNVKQGDLIARLSNPELEREVLRLATEHRQAELKLRRLEIARGHDPTAAAQIPAAREAEQSLARRTEKKQRDVEQLSIRATVEGKLLPPVPRTPPPRPTLELADWNGEPLSDHNLGCWLDAGTLLGQIANENSLSPTLLVGQHDVDLVRIGQTVRMRFDARPSEVVLGEVVEIAAEPVAARSFNVLEGSSGRQEQGVEGNSPGPKNSGVRFACRVRLVGSKNSLPLRDSGVARISIEPATAVEQAGRWLRQTFRFR